MPLSTKCKKNEKQKMHDAHLHSMKILPQKEKQNN